MKLHVLWATLASAVAMMLIGFLCYVVILDDVFVDMGVSADYMKAEPDMIFIFLGNIAAGALIAYIYDRWAGISTFGTGASAGAIIGLLIALYAGLIQYATTTLSPSVTPYLLDTVVSAIIWAIGGGVVGLVLGKLGPAKKG